MISVVIAVRDGSAPVCGLLESLRLPPLPAEIIIANCCGEDVTRAIARCYPEAIVVDVPPETSLADSRHLAIEKASGNVIAVLHERYQIREGWIETIKRSHESNAAEVITGCVGPKTPLSRAQWAMYLSEYMNAAPPKPSGHLSRAEAMIIPAGSTSYKREVFRKGSMAGHLWEIDFHGALFDRGAEFYRDSQIVVDWATPYSIPEYIAERKRVSRDFAAWRAAKMRTSTRVVSAFSRIALPPLVLARVARAAFRNRALAKRFTVALPWILGFAMVQTWGEMQGYWKKRV